MSEINVRQRFKQPVDQVFAAFSTHAGLNKLFWPMQVVRTKDAADPTNLDGVGSVRHMGFGPVKPLAEQITSFEQNSCIEYTVVSKAPIRHHKGQMTFMADGDGTMVNYKIELDSAVPFLAPMTLLGLQTALRVGLARMARAKVL